MIAYYTLLTIILTSFTYLLYKIFRLIKFNYEIYPLLKKIPGPDFPIWPLNSKMIRNLLTSKDPFNDFFNILNRMADDYADEGIFCFARGAAAHIVITDPVIAQKILSSEEFLDKSSHYRLMRLAISDNLFTCNRNTLRKHKREMLPHFRVQSLCFYLQNSYKYIHTTIDNIEKCIDSSNDGRYDNFQVIVDSYIADTMGGNFFTTEFDSCANNFKVNKRVELVEEGIQEMAKYFTHLMLFLPPMKFMKLEYFLPSKFINFLRYFNEQVYEMIMERIRANLTDEKPSDPLLMLDTMIRSRISDGKVTNIDEIDAAIKIMLVAGFDTSKTTLSWIFYLLGHHPDVQQRLYEEIDEYLRDLGKNNEEITIMNMKRLKYMDSCIYETLRLYPPGVMIGRRARNPVKLSNSDIVIPPKTNIVVFLWKMGRNPKYFVEPDRFNPDRYYNDEMNKQKGDNDDQNRLPLRLAFFPFSSGIRTCIGKEYAFVQMRLFIIHILSRYKVTSLNKYGDLQPHIAFIHPAAKFPMRFERRECNEKL